MAVTSNTGLFAVVLVDAFTAAPSYGCFVTSDALFVEYVVLSLWCEDVLT
jgi:hypothetical protein